MVNSRTLRRWDVVHTWSSLVCTIFLLIICISGLPLVFGDEIRQLLDPPLPYAKASASTPSINLDLPVGQARQAFPQDVISSVFVDNRQPRIVVSMAPSWQALADDADSEHTLTFDAHTGQLLARSDHHPLRGEQWMNYVHELHTALFLDLSGEIFLGIMAASLLLSLLSGVVLYRPFMGKLPFGTIRRERHRRTRWLDQHNLLGIATVAWLAIVGVTGLMNELEQPLFALWQRQEILPRVATYGATTRPLDATQMTSVQTAYQIASHAVPGMTITGIVYPGSPYGTPGHYLFWSQGDTPLTSQLFQPVMVDAGSGSLVAVLHMPWYLRAIEVSRPLHFGNYGGLWLKSLWALLDLLAIAVLVTGIYLWITRRRAHKPRNTHRMRGQGALPS
jgi:uncharacterized iron-regulated membrane protein